jgi:hypothetical protein
VNSFHIADSSAEVAHAPQGRVPNLLIFTHLCQDSQSENTRGTARIAILCDSI